MKFPSAKVAMLTALAALVLQWVPYSGASAQQRVPAMPEAVGAGAGAGAGQKSPLGKDIYMQKTPGAGGGDKMYTPTIYAPGPGQWPAGTAEDACSLAGVDASELGAVRKAIEDMLSGSAQAAANFTQNEQKLQKNCPRARAAFYLRVIAKIREQK